MKMSLNRATARHQVSRKWAVAGLSAMVIASLVTACGSSKSSSNSESKGPIEIGFTTDYAGAIGALFGSAQNGFTTYINYVNDHGGVNGQKIKVVSLNDQADPASASVNLNQLHAQGAVLVIANTLSNAFSGLMPLASRIQTPLVVASLLSPDPVPYVYGYEPDPPGSIVSQINFAHEYLLKDKSDVRIAWVNIGDATAPGMKTGIEQRAGQLGWKLVDTEVMPPSATSFTVQAGKIAAAHPDLVLANSSFLSDPTIDKALRDSGVKAPIVEWWGGYSPSSLKTVGDPDFYTYYNYIAPDVTSLPAVATMRQEAQTYKLTIPDNGSFTAWYVFAQAVVAALKQCGSGCSASALNDALQTNATAVQTQGLSTKVGFTKSNHTFANTSQFVHADGGQIVNVGQPVPVS